MESRIARLALSAPAGKTLALPVGVRTTQDGQVIVIMEPPPGLEASAIDIKGLEQIGAEVLARSRHLLRVVVPVGKLLSAAEVPGVHFIRPPMGHGRRGDGGGTVSGRGWLDSGEGNALMNLFGTAGV
jgi:hypothetical protein